MIKNTFTNVVQGRNDASMSNSTTIDVDHSTTPVNSSDLLKKEKNTDHIIGYDAYNKNFVDNNTHPLFLHITIIQG